MSVIRTLPKVEPPKLGLEISETPLVREISRARVFEEPLVPIGGEPSAEENAALAGALMGYARRSEPDDFTSLTEFLERHPNSSWRASLLTCLGLEYYHTAHYSLALAAWEKVWPNPGRHARHGWRRRAERQLQCAGRHGAPTFGRATSPQAATPPANSTL